MDYSDEIWKPVKSLNSICKTKEFYANQYGHIKIVNQVRRQYAIYRSFNHNSRGYARICTRINEKTKNFSIHRLVAEAWIPNPNNLPFINHKDQNKSNNEISNLEWCNNKYNSTYMDARIRAGRSNRKYILQYDLEGNFIARHFGLVECAKNTNCSKSDVSNCCKGRVFQAKGNIFIYEKNGFPLEYYLAGKRHWKVLQYDANGIVNTFDTIRQAAICTGIDDSSICKVLNNQMNTAGGYIWRYKKPVIK